MNKFCMKCGAILAENAVFCGECGAKCGEEKEERKVFCSKCGEEVKEGMHFCTGCGHPVSNSEASAYNNFHQTVYTQQSSDLVQRVSERVKTNAIIWIVIASLQLLLSIFVNWSFLIVGIINLISAISDLNYSKSVLQNSAGIVDKVKSLVGPIVTLVYNLLFGGVIGVAGSIYYLVAVRGFVMENESAFRLLENRCIEKNDE